VTPRHPFHDPATHGFVRVAAATPGVAVSDPTGNADFAIALAERAHAEHVDLVVFPELNLSSYAIDDLHLQDGMLRAVDAALARVVEASASLRPVLLVGAPLVRNGRIYNCAAVVAHGELLGVVPKSYLPNYREYYEKRWFAPGAGIVGEEITAAGRTVPFGTDLRFVASDHDGLDLFVEICEDYWAATPPSSIGALAGALILANLSASNIVIGKARDRALLCAAQSMRTQSAYVYSAAGPGESTTDLAWDGQGLVYELGELLVASERFLTEPDLVVADVDAGRIRLERMRTGTFNDAAAANDHPERRFRTVTFEHRGACERTEDDARYELRRPVARFPFVPDDRERLDADCYEAFNIQVEGLVTRFRATRGEHVVIGVSGGLDSTHALVVAARAFDRMGIDRSKILGYTMPGFATSDTTKTNAWALMRALGITAEEIDIRPAARQMLADMRHPFAAGERVYDVAFENVQAGLRTDYLFRLANANQGFVLGTGDLSEIALGWSTYGVGDQMSHYNVNSGVPKTLIQYLIRWAVRTGEFDDEETDRILLSILDTVISPELVPAHEDAPSDSGPGDEPAMQSTEDQIGPYELHDFFLHHVARQGLAPSKVAFLAWHAWRDPCHGGWPEGFPEEKKNEYDLDHIRGWLEEFLHRFFGFSQFKRSAMPNGPKVSGGGSLSPRGDWRAPSDASAGPWLDELAAGLPPSDA